MGHAAHAAGAARDVATRVPRGHAAGPSEPLDVRLEIWPGHGREQTIDRSADTDLQRRPGRRGHLVCALSAARLSGDHPEEAPLHELTIAHYTLLGSRLIFSARLLREIDEVRVAVWQMVIALPLFAAGGAAFETIAWENLSVEPIAGLAFQGVVIAGLGFMASFWLMKHYTPSVMVSFNFVSPVAGVLLGAWLLDEPVGPWMLAGLLAVALGLYVVARR